MIYDTLANAKLYHSVNPLFKRAFDYIASLPATIEDGRYPIQGDQCYAIIYRSALRSAAEAPLEVHDRYVDLQVVLSGKERFGVATRKTCLKAHSPMDTEKDIMFFDDSFDSSIELQQGDFAIFMPDDAHAPLIGQGEVRKIVVKVAVV